MIRRLSEVALATTLIASCTQPAPTSEPQPDNHAAQIATERAAEAQVIDRVTLARLSRDVAALQEEVDTIKASRQALDQEVIEARLRALESRSAGTSASPAAAQAEAPTPLPTPTSVPHSAKPVPVTRPASKPKGGGR